MTIRQQDMKDELERFKATVQYPLLEIPTEIHDLLNMTRDEMKAKTREELNMDSLQLYQYAAYIKMQRNRIHAAMTWCQGNIDSIVSRELGNIGEAFGLKEKTLKVIQVDSNAKQLHNEQIKLQGKLDLLDDIDIKVEYIAKAVNNLSYAKRENYHGS
jgi:hypothetical protein